MHDFVRDSVRAALMKARPVPQFVSEIHAHATASQSLTPGAVWEPSSGDAGLPAPAFVFRKPDGKPEALVSGGFALQAPVTAADFPTLSVRRRHRRRSECGCLAGATQLEIDPRQRLCSRARRQ